MKLPPMVERNVEAGLVLDRKGRWIPLATAVERERELRSRVEQGEMPADQPARDSDALDAFAASSSGPTETVSSSGDGPVAGETSRPADDTPIQSDTVLVEIEVSDEDTPGAGDDEGARVSSGPESDTAASGERMAPIEKEDTQRMSTMGAERGEPEADAPADSTDAPPQSPAAPAAATPASAPAQAPAENTAQSGAANHQALIDSFDDWEYARRKRRKIAAAVAAAVGGAAAAAFVAIKFLLG